MARPRIAYLHLLNKLENVRAWDLLVLASLPRGRSFGWSGDPADGGPGTSGGGGRPGRAVGSERVWGLFSCRCAPGAAGAQLGLVAGGPRGNLEGGRREAQAPLPPVSPGTLTGSLGLVAVCTRRRLGVPAAQGKRTRFLLNCQRKDAFPSSLPIRPSAPCTQGGPCGVWLLPLLWQRLGVGRGFPHGLNGAGGVVG